MFRRSLLSRSKLGYVTFKRGQHSFNRFAPTFNRKPVFQWRSFALVLGATGVITFAGAFSEASPIHLDLSSEGKTFTKETDKSILSLESMPSIKFDTTQSNLNGAREEFVTLLGANRVRQELSDCVAHSSTAWSEAPRGDLDRPTFVLLPESTEEVSAIAKICHRRRIPIIGYSGGTSLEGTLAATYGGVCVDFGLMNKILALHKDDIDVVVQPGVSYEELNEQMGRDGLFFPPDPGPGAKIGGMISQGCSGTNAFRYGTIKDWVLGLTIVLADGTVVKTRGRPRKSSSGYNLTQLMVGSEGTLGLITEASLKLTSKPQNNRVAVAAFPDIHSAVATAVLIVRNGIQVEAMELLDEMSMRAVNQGGYCAKEYGEIPHLFFKFAGSSLDVVSEQIKRVQDMAKEQECLSFEASNSAEEASSVWAARKTALWSILALKKDPSEEFISSDTAVPISRLGEAVEFAKKLTKGGNLRSSFIGHVGDGNIHTGILFAANDKAKARNAITEIQRKAIALDGTVTGEHGIGLEFRDMVAEELGEDAVDMMRAVKLSLDPLCILNPDKVFRLKIIKSDS